MSINKVFVSGNLTRDPELRQTNTSTTAVLNFGIAVNDRRRNQQTGEWEDHPNYFDCTVFGNRAVSLNKILSKGMKVSLEGKLRWSQWEKDGQKRTSVTILVDDIEFLSSKNDGKGGGGAPASAPSNDAPVVDTSASVSDDDIPF